MRGYEIFVELSDLHIALKHPALLRIGYVQDAFGDPLPQLEIEADDGYTNSIFLDQDMLEELMTACIDLLHELEVSVQ